MKDHSAEQRLRHYGPCYLAGAPASAGALPSKDRKNVQSAGLISGRSTELAARGTPAVSSDLLVNRAFDRDIMSMKTIGIHFTLLFTQPLHAVVL